MADTIESQLASTSLSTNATQPSKKEKRHNELRIRVKKAYSQATPDHVRLIDNVFGDIYREDISTSKLDHVHRTLKELRSGRKLSIRMARKYQKKVLMGMSEEEAAPGSRASAQDMSFLSEVKNAAMESTMSPKQMGVAGTADAHQLEGETVYNGDDECTEVGEQEENDDDEHEVPEEDAHRHKRARTRLG